MSDELAVVCLDLQVPTHYLGIHTAGEEYVPRRDDQDVDDCRSVTLLLIADGSLFHFVFIQIHVAFIVIFSGYFGVNICTDCFGYFFRLDDFDWFESI